MVLTFFGNPQLLSRNTMTFIAAIGFLSCVFSLLLTPICRDVADCLGIVDVPDHRRKVHTGPIARIGGIPIFLSIALAIVLCSLMQRWLCPVGIEWGDLFRVIPALGLTFLTGLVDDLRGLKPWQKLAGEILGGTLAVAAGVQIDSLGGIFIGNTWWHVPLTVVWLVGCANALNLIDGVDGLAAGVGFFAAATTLIAGLLSGNSALALATVPLVSALLGFLRYNFNPATIFLGDCGSLSIGFLLGCYGVVWSQKSATLLGMTAPLIALSVPLADTTLAIVRRFLRGQPIFGADRRHIHHLLLERGLTPRRVVLLLYGIAGIAAACSLLISFSGNKVGGFVIILFCVGAWVGVQHLGYGEFNAARHVLFGGVIGRSIDAQLDLRQLDRALRAADTPEKRWSALTDAGCKFGFSVAQLALNGHVWREHLGSAPDSECWQLRVPLNGSGMAQFSVPFESKVRPVMLASFARLIHDDLLPAAESHNKDT